MQLDPFSSFGVRNPRLSAKEPTQEKRAETENRELGKHRGKGKRDDEKSFAREEEEAQTPSTTHVVCFGSLSGNFSKREEEKPRVGELLLNVERNREK